jgi:hypothetical protein
MLAKYTSFLFVLSLTAFLYFTYQKTDKPVSYPIPIEVEFITSKHFPANVTHQTIHLFLIQNSEVIVDEVITQCRKSSLACHPFSTLDIYNPGINLKDYRAEIVSPSGKAKKFKRKGNKYIAETTFKEGDTLSFRALSVGKRKLELDPGVIGYLDFPFLKVQRKQKLETSIHRSGTFLFSLRTF